MKQLLFTTTLFVTILLGSTNTFAQSLVSTWNTSGPNICDGGACLTDSININETSIYWTGAGTVMQQGGWCLTSLCPGTYTVTYSLNGNTITETFTIGWGSGDPCASLYVIVDSTPTSGGLLCDGTATATAYGGTSPYSYSWDNGLNGNPLTGLCEGVYYVTVTDANGCVSTNGVYVSNASDSTLVIDNTGNYDSTNIDGSIGSGWIEDCEIDFGAIDSAFAQGGVINAGTIEVTWVFVDTNGVVVNTYTEIYGVPDSLNGNYTVSVTIFCPQRANGINTIQVVDVLALGQAGITEESELEFTVSNPFNDQVLINFESDAKRVITLMDMNGKVVVSMDESLKSVSLNTSMLSGGMYILNVTDAKGQSTRKLIKN